MRFQVSTPPAVPAGTLAAGPQPTLPAEGGLVLRPWADGDAPTVLAAYQDPEIRRWHTRRPASPEQVLQWFAHSRRSWQEETGASWAVTRGDEVVGRMTLGGVNLDDGEAACAYWVVPAARGTGVASGALRALSAWALADGRLHRLWLDHSTGNVASCRVAVKAGFRLEGTKRSAAVHDDGRHDMHLHARVRGDD
ncbi:MULTISPECIES: GNAT family N-acetyltransferase [Micromonospora]|uniref:GNAT family N-acetyltransferase n=1 Tax=Micromonospora TaxID=1873 RepID=UPI0003EEC607|nr:MULTISPECIES: GNAT family N-acetyltransferase [Micromonospora]EWM68217.1 acetyltransferase [Micromonospora sp. M42]MBC8991418.1 GNAT family N-acetyltransferase [Micromonospora chalcea]MBQ1067005.1 GNAT family N-acetyltransferase [Micromonospora sp. D75]MCK1806445.1 GNAT family N-acetyltransferase [Micromonospora sp. R42106]MCK1831922.1 GNAT family N-acetyltransferase [Micromonospora sp. R42003]